MAASKRASRARAGGTEDGRARAVIDRVIPAVDCGRFAVKRVVGDTMLVEADCFTDGHDALAASSCWRREGRRRTGRRCR
jgi:hypothetical protein